MGTASRVIKNTGWLYAKMAITMFISLWTTRLILNGLGASDFGIFNIVGGAISMLGFLNAAMASATQRFMSYAAGENNVEKEKIIFNVSIVLHLIIGVIISIILVLSGFVFFNAILNIPAGREYAAYVVYGSLIVSTFLTIINVPYDAVMNAHENMKYYAIIGVLESILKLSIAFICVYSDSDKLIIYGILMACIPMFTLSIMKVYCHKNYQECRISLFNYWDLSTCREIGKFAGWNLLSTSTSMITQYGFGVVLNYFFGTVLNAAQGIATQLSGMLMVFSNNMQKALNPVIVKMEGHGNRESMIETSITGCKYSFFLLGCFAIPSIIQMPFILKLWLKNIPEWAICFSSLQLLRFLLEQLTITLTSAISAQGDIKKFSRINSVLFILPLFLTIVCFYYRLPPYWMYITWILFWAIFSGYAKLIYCKRQCGLNIYSYLHKTLFPCLSVAILSVISGVGVSTLGNETYISLLSIIISFLVFVVSFVLLCCSNVERKMLFNMVTSAYKKVR